MFWGSQLILYKIHNLYTSNSQSNRLTAIEAAYSEKENLMRVSLKDLHIVINRWFVQHVNCIKSPSGDVKVYVTKWCWWFKYSSFMHLLTELQNINISGLVCQNTSLIMTHSELNILTAMLSTSYNSIKDCPSFYHKKPTQNLKPFFVWILVWLRLWPMQI